MMPTISTVSSNSRKICQHLTLNWFTSIISRCKLVAHCDLFQKKSLPPPFAFLLS